MRKTDKTEGKIQFSLKVKCLGEDTGNVSIIWLRILADLHTGNTFRTYCCQLEGSIVLPGSWDGISVQVISSAAYCHFLL